MANWRKLWGKVIESQDFDDMPDDFTRLTWTLLMLALDSEGRAIDKASFIRSRIYPLRDDITNEQVQSALDWFATRGMIQRYEVNGRSYFYQVNFNEYQGTRAARKEPDSTIPEPVAENPRITPELVESNSGVILEESAGNTALDKERLREREKSDASAGDSDFSAVYKLFEQLDPRAQVTQIQVDDLKDLIREHGHDRLVFAIREASDHGAPTMAYIKGVLKGKPRASPAGFGMGKQALKQVIPQRW